MSNFYPTITKSIRKEADEQIAILEQLPAGQPVSHLCIDTVFMHNLSYSMCMQHLHELRASLGNYKLTRYSMSGEALAMTYRFKGFDYDVNYYASDADHALEQVGKGKCRIEEVPQPASRRVVCDV